MPLSLPLRLVAFFRHRAIVLLGWSAALAACIIGILALPAFGHAWPAFTALALLTAFLVLRWRKGPSLGRAVTAAQALMLLVLIAWLGLILWWQLSPGGAAPPPKADAAAIRVVTWNVHVGHEGGAPWQRFDWAARRGPLATAITEAAPDVLCLQEPVAEQVEFLEKALPTHDRVGIGRDGGEAGEYCAIFYRRDRFERLDSGTFWLEEPSDQPGPSHSLDAKRICTWARLRDRDNGRILRVYNAHSYLTEAPRQEAARQILAHIAAGDPADAVVLTADFNAPSSSPSRHAFSEAGLTDSAVLAGKRAGVPTFHLYGVPLTCLDGILVSQGCSVGNHRILDAKPQRTLPSDHFGVLADIRLGG